MCSTGRVANTSLRSLNYRVVVVRTVTLAHTAALKNGVQRCTCRPRSVFTGTCAGASPASRQLLNGTARGMTARLRFTGAGQETSLLFLRRIWFSRRSGIFRQRLIRLWGNRTVSRISGRLGWLRVYVRAHLCQGGRKLQIVLPGLSGTGSTSSHQEWASPAAGPGS